MEVEHIEQSLVQRAIEEWPAWEAEVEAAAFMNLEMGLEVEAE
jgi:hypothetical protein